MASHSLFEAHPQTTLLSIVLFGVVAALAIAEIATRLLFPQKLF